MNVSELPYQTNIDSIFARFSTLPGCIWLDSGKPNSNMGRFDIISALPAETVHPNGHSDLAYLENKLRDNEHTSESYSNLPFTGGWIGYLPYAFNHQLLKVTLRPDDESRGWFGWFTWAIIVDHKVRRSYLVFTPECSETTKNTVLFQLDQPNPTTPPTSYQCSPFVADEKKERYLQSIRTVHKHLTQGNSYQINYAQRFSASFDGSAFAAYRKLRACVPSPFSAFLNTGDHQILSISPERFIQIDQRHAITQPIKGTIKRGDTEQEDHKQLHTLRNSEKDQAENIMIVDLLRNDFSKSCSPGSVKATRLFEIQSFANVHHLVSSIEGQLTHEISHCHFISDCFPGGSITGAPKKSSMEIIGKLELHSRGPYCGSIGYFSRNQKSDFNIAIRTLQVKDGHIYAWAGGGIVHDSIAEDEYQECLSKIQTFLANLNS